MNLYEVRFHDGRPPVEVSADMYDTVDGDHVFYQHAKVMPVATFSEDLVREVFRREYDHLEEEQEPGGGY